MVLISRLDDGRTLYAVEREDRGLYAICKLGSWVDLPELRATAAASRQDIGLPLTKKFELVAGPPIVSRSQTQTDDSSSGKKKRLAIEAIQSMVKRTTSEVISESQTQSFPDNIAQQLPSEVPSVQAQEDTQSDPSIQPRDDALAQQNASEILDNIRNQYFEALYLSKASLAYFAKGPLSRARAAFHLDCDSNLDMKDLVQFLEDMVMTTSVLEKKYKDGLPNCISLIDIEDHSAAEAERMKTKRRKSTKKMKPGKNGLFPGEEDNIRKWWSIHDEDIEFGIPGQTREDIVKARLSKLRSRETQLQMILILEVTALKPQIPDTDGDLILPDDSLTISVAKATKLKRPDQLSKLMNVHIDRLCIWQSIASDSVKVTSGTGPQTVAKSTDTITRDFCVDIVAPL